MVNSTTPQGDYEELTTYLASFLSTNHNISRVDCCGTSRSLFCHECCGIVLPESSWPDTIVNGELKLPFDLDLVLHDRRKSSSGLHAIVLLKASAEAREQPSETDNLESSVRLIDVKRNDPVPSYDQDDNVYLLYPSPGVSKSLESVVKKISNSVGNSKHQNPKKRLRLVVLDCKWTRTVMQFHPNLATLPRVHLTLSEHTKSHFWRWHNAGPGMVSTLEAIYYAARQVVRLVYNNGHNNDPQVANASHQLLNILWLFGLQRELIHRRGLAEGRSFLPTTEDGKEEQRALRRRTQEQRQQKRLEGKQRKQQQIAKKQQEEGKEFDTGEGM